MVRHVRAFFDGKVIVPQEPIDWPVNQPLNIRLMDEDRFKGGVPDNAEANPTAGAAERRRRLALASGFFSAAPPCPESLRRESIYGDE